MNFENLSPEQMAKARACKTPEDILALAKAEGYELSDDELQAISGGGSWSCGDCREYVSRGGYVNPCSNNIGRRY